MQLRTVARALILATGVLAVAACQQFSPDNDARTLSFNYAVARSTNEILLLNIVRASQRQPTYYTRLGGNSAQSTLSASVAGTFPFGVLSKGQAVLTPQASAQNLLTLGNLDDKKYQDGALARIDLAKINDFWDEGVQPDLLGLLFISRIELPASELPLVWNAVRATCTNQASTSWNKYCLALKQVGYLGAGEAPPDCLNPRVVPLALRNGKPYAVYINDPAWVNPGERLHPTECFQLVLRNLLALGLHPQSRKSLEEVDADIPDAVENNGRFRADMIKGGFKVGPNEAGDDTHVTKNTPETVFALDAHASYLIRREPADRTGREPDYRTDVLQCKNPSEPGRRDLDARARKAEQKRLAKTNPETETECDATLFSDDAYLQMVENKTISTNDIKIALTIRSFEGVVYYLGEVVRLETSDIVPKPENYVPKIVGRGPWGGEPMADEVLFDVRKNSAPPSAAVVVKDDKGKNYWIPDFCDVDQPMRGTDSCRYDVENPDHESLTVLTLVNQLWGLQKEPSTAPTPTITVGGG